MINEYKIFQFNDGWYLKKFNERGIVRTENPVDALRINDRNEFNVDLMNGREIIMTVTTKYFVSNMIKDRVEPKTFKGKLAMIKREQKLSERVLSGMLYCGKSTVHGWLNGVLPSRRHRKSIQSLYDFYYKE